MSELPLVRTDMKMSNDEFLSSRLMSSPGIETYGRVPFEAN